MAVPVQPPGLHGLPLLTLVQTTDVILKLLHQFDGNDGVGVAEHFIPSPAEHALGSRIPEGQVQIQVQGDDGRRRRVDQRLQHLVRPPQGILGMFAVRNVAQVLAGHDHPAGRVEYGKGVYLQMPDPGIELLGDNALAGLEYLSQMAGFATSPLVWIVHLIAVPVTPASVGSGILMPSPPVAVDDLELRVHHGNQFRNRLQNAVHQLFRRRAVTVM